MAALVAGVGGRPRAARGCCIDPDRVVPWPCPVAGLARPGGIVALSTTLLLLWESCLDAWVGVFAPGETWSGLAYVGDCGEIVLCRANCNSLTGDVAEDHQLPVRRCASHSIRDLEV